MNISKHLTLYLLFLWFYGSFMLQRKRRRFLMGSWGIQFNIYIEQRQRSKKKSRFRSNINEPLNGFAITM